MSCLMSTNLFAEIEKVVFEKFNEKCSFEEMYNIDTRFSYCLTFLDFSLIIYGTDARVCLKVRFDDCRKNIKKILLSAITKYDEDTKKFLKPYKSFVWKNQKEHYEEIPNEDALTNEIDAYLEICSPPRDISSSDKAKYEISLLIYKTLDWINSYKSFEPQGSLEGERRLNSQSKVERSRANRERCIKLYGYKCQICGLQMSDKYGEIATNFIHVHHIESISKSGPRWVNPEKDLLPICPNCHSIIHIKEPPLKPEELRKIIASNKESC